MNERIQFSIAVGLLLLASCKTPPPPTPEPPADDQVESGATDTPDVGIDEQTDAQQPDATDPTDPNDQTDQTEQKTEKPDKPDKPDKPVTFVEEPKLPSELGFQEMALVRTAEQRGRPGIAFAPSLNGEGCGLPESILASVDFHDDGQWYSIDECARAIDAVHAKTYERHITKFGVFDISGVALRHNGNDVWSAKEDCLRIAEFSSACPSDFHAQTLRVASIVGPVVSYTIESTEAGGGGPPYHTEYAFTVDTRLGKEIAFDTLVTEDSILNALKRDSHMRRTLNPTKLDAAETLDEVWSLWRTQDFAKFGAYYFNEWSADRGQAAMRILYLEDQSGLQPNKLKELGVWVTPKSQYLPAFEAAAAKNGGFYAGK